MKRVMYRRSQRGVTLIVALVMLVIIGFMSAAMMRGALTGDTIANNLRVQNYAMQQAQLGLRYCEHVVEKNRLEPQSARSAAGIPPPASAPPPPPPEPPASYPWQAFKSWHDGLPIDDGQGAQDVPREWYVGSAVNELQPPKAPQCLIALHKTLDNTYVITARGFSPDWSEDGDGRTKSGSVVWLQSIVAM